jgi:LYAR-type C2HC zinc finger
MKNEKDIIFIWASNFALTFSFSANSYVLHTKCISEQEKYSGGNFKPKASTVNKQDKQGRWLGMIQTVAQRKDYSRNAVVQNILDFLASHQAVPNKEKAFWVNRSAKEKYFLIVHLVGLFQNFMNTVPFHLRNSNASSIVWGLLMKERAEEDAKSKPQLNGKSNGKQKSTEKAVEPVKKLVIKEVEPAKKLVEKEAEPANFSSKVPETWMSAIKRLSQGGGPFAEVFQSLSKLNDVPTDSKKAFKVCKHSKNCMQ